MRRQQLFPGPTSFDLTILRKFQDERHLAFALMNEKYGSIAQLTVFGKVILFISDLDDVRCFVTNKMFYDRDDVFEGTFPKSVVGLPTGKKWRAHRRVLDVVFNERHMVSYVAQIEKLVKDKLVKKWSHLAEPDHNVQRDILCLALDIIGKIGFKRDFHSFEDPQAEKKFRAQTQSILDDVMMNMIYPKWVRKVFFYKTRRKCREARELFRDLGNEIKKEYYKEREEKEEKEEEDGNGTEELAIIDVLLKALEDGVFEDDEVHDDLISLILAGHETTSMMLSWTLYLLSQNPRVMKKLQEEVDSVLDKGRAITYVDIFCGNLKYARNVLMESLRLYPPAIGVARCVKDDDVKLKGKLLQKGDLVIANNMGIWL